MESSTAAEVEKGVSGEDSTQLNRNRSFKSKLLVRSQAIREAQSPPRTVSPSLRGELDLKKSPTPSSNGDENSPAPEEWKEDIRKSASEGCVSKEPVQQVEIQITSGGWDCRTDDGGVRRRWQTQAQPELLSNNPRVTCVCGGCRGHESRRARLCVDCRGRRRYGGVCPAKQDSGIGCSQECPDCIDSPEAHVSPAKDPLEQRRHRPRHKSESHDDPDTCRCQDRKERIPKIASLNRNDSEEISPEQLAWFLRETLNKNSRDRRALLKIEKELIALVNDVGRCVLRFPSVSSYGRMLIHRCAELFQLKHTLDHLNKNTVLVSKTGTCGGRIPCTRFRDWCTAVLSPSPQRHDDGTQAKSILKRSAHSLDEVLGGGAAAGGAALRSKSFEQREEEYERVRRRIFSTEDGQSEESQWPWLPAGPVKLLTPDNASKHNRLLKVQSLESQGPASGGGNAARGPVSKSHSFGGYGREEQRPRILSRQGDLASSSWRLSPSSSGYKTLSLRSTDSVTPSPTGGVSPEPGVPPLTEGGGVMWVLTDPAAIPLGAVIIHPQTGRPYTNPDGSVYQYDPTRPLPNTAPTTNATPTTDDNTGDQNVEKRRGRLEKQNSFIDTECECHTEGYPSENCCTCCDAKSQVDWSHQCYHTNQEIIKIPKNQELFQKPPTTENNIINNSTKLNHDGTTNSKFESANPNNVSTNQSHLPPNHIHEANPAQRQPANQESQLMNRAMGLNGTTNHDDVNEKREDDSYQFATDYGPNVNNNMVHYTMPYYQHVNQNFRANEEVQGQAPAVTSPFPQDTQPQAPNKSLVNYDPAIRPQLSLGGLVYPTGVNHNAYPYTNHCRTNAIPETVPQLYAVVSPENKNSPEQEQSYQEPYFQQTLLSELVPGYQYGLMGLTHQVGCAGTCGVDPVAGVFHCIAQAQRGLSVTYAQALEQQQMIHNPGYQVPNVLLPQNTAPHTVHHSYQFATSNQWPPSWQPTLIAAPNSIPPSCATPVQKAPTPPNIFIPQPEIPLTYSHFKPEFIPTYPVIQYSNYAYPQYNIVPQLIPNSYPMLHPVYPLAVERNDTTRRNSGIRSYESLQNAAKLNMARPKTGSVTNSSRTTPLHRVYTPPVIVDEAAKPVAQVYPNVPYNAPKDPSSPNRRLSKQTSLDGYDRRRPFRVNSRDNFRRDSVNSTELASKIQHIKEQMTHMNVNQDRVPMDNRNFAHANSDARVKSFPPQEPEQRPRLNSSGSLLGDYPIDPQLIPGIPVAHDGSQLSSAARAIVNSIRSMQSRVNNTFHHDNSRRRFDYPANFPQRAPFQQYRQNDRNPYEPRYDNQRNLHRPYNQYDKQEHQIESKKDNSSERNTPNVQDRIQIAPEKDQNLPDQNFLDRTSAKSNQNVSEARTPKMPDNLTAVEKDHIQNLPKSPESLPEQSQTVPENNLTVPAINPNVPYESNLSELHPNVPERSISESQSTPNFSDRTPTLPANHYVPERLQSLPRNQNAQERIQNLPEHNHNITERVQNFPERSQSIPDSIQNIRREADGRRRDQRSQDMRVDGQFLRNRNNMNPMVSYQYGRPYMFRQVTAGGWCRRSPGPPVPNPAGFNPRYGPRRPAPDTRRR